MSVERLTAVVGARIAEFKRKMAEVNAIARNAAREIRTEVDARTEPFQRAMARVRAQIAAMNGRTIWINIRARSDRFQNEMDELSNVIRTFGTVGKNMFGGALMTLLPMLVPIIAGATAAVATLGVALGVLGGSAVALASSLSLALLGFVGLGIALIPTIHNIKEARTEIAEGRRTLESYSGPMERVIRGLDKMNSTWLYLNEAIEPQILNAFGAGMESATILMEKLTPGIKLVATAFEGLMESMKKAISTAPDMQANFAWFNERAAQAVTSWGEIVGYAFRGFLNLMRAFDPLARDTEAGLLRMTKRFSEWADGLSKSDKFKAFMDYVRENTPKVNAIIGNLITGFINLFVAFGPLAAEMLTGFQKMTERFKEWSAALGDNKNFQGFINYIRENGPGVISLIGNIVTALVEIGKAMAPLGAFLLKMTNGFLQWFNSMMQGSPIFRGIVASVLSLLGIFRMAIPLVIFFRTIFAGAFTAIWRAFVPFRGALIGGLRMMLTSFLGFVSVLAPWGARIVGVFVSIVTGVGGFFGRIAFMLGEFVVILGRVLVQGLAWAGRMAAMWLVAAGPIAWVIAAVVALAALIIWKWDEIKAWSISTWNAIWPMIKSVWAKIVSATSMALSLVVEYVKSKFSQAKEAAISVWNQILSGLSNIITNIKTAVSNGITNVVERVKSGFSNLVSNTISLWNNIVNAIKTAWSNIKSNVQSAVTTVISNVKSGFSNMKSNIVSIWNAIVSAIKTAWNNIKSAVTSAINTVKSTVQSGFNSAKSTVTSIMSSIVSAIRTAWNNAVNAARSALNNMKSTVSSIMNGILSFIKGLGGSFKSAGRGLIDMMARGITSGIDKVTGAVRSVAAKVRNFLPFSPAKVGPLSDLDKLDFGGPIKDSIVRASSIVSRQMGNMLQMPSLSPLEVATPASNAVYTPQVNMPEIKTNNNDSKQGAQNISLTMRLGRRDYGTFVSDISQTQKELELRERREAGE